MGYALVYASTEFLIWASHISKYLHVFTSVSACVSVCACVCVCVVYLENTLDLICAV